MSGGARAGLLLAGLVCAALACFVDQASSPLDGWARRHPDPRAATEEQLAEFDETAEGNRVEDLRLLLGALACGCLAAAALPRVAAWSGGVVPGVLVAGSLGLGLWSLGASVLAQREAEAWTLADDNASAVAGPLAPGLLAWREHIAPEDVVLAAGGRDVELNDLAWLLFPRPVFHLPAALPAGMDLGEASAALRATELARERGRRWLVDLDRLRASPGAPLDALAAVDP